MSSHREKISLHGYPVDRKDIKLGPVDLGQSALLQRLLPVIFFSVSH